MLMFISPEAAKITSNDLEQCFEFYRILDTPDHRTAGDATKEKENNENN